MLAKDFLHLDNLSGNFIIEGDDAYLRDKVIESAISHLPDGLVEFNYQAMSGGKDIGSDIVVQLMMVPAMSDVRIVYVKELTEKLSKKSLDFLKEYLENPYDYSVLIINNEKGYASALKKYLTTIECASYMGIDSIKSGNRYADGCGRPATPVIQSFSINMKYA